MPTLSDIEAAAKAHAADRAQLEETVSELNAAIDAARRRSVPIIKRRLAKAAESHAALHALLADAAQLFVKPRTLILHGIKVGYEKGKGTVTWEDPARVVTLIRRHLPDQFEALVKVSETPRKTAIAQLPAADVKRIGCSVQDAGDQVVIRPVDSEVDKMVDALLRDATAGAEAEEADA